MAENHVWVFHAVIVDIFLAPIPLPHRSVPSRPDMRRRGEHDNTHRMLGSLLDEPDVSHGPTTALYGIFLSYYPFIPAAMR